MDNSPPAAPNASTLAARNFGRSGAARSELVIVRCRHSPVMPTIASIRMKKLDVSISNTSLTTESFVGSLSEAPRETKISAEADRHSGERVEGPGGAQLDQLG